MSTRYDLDGETTEWEWVRFQGAVASGLRSKRGQALLGQLRDALLSMPEHKLARGVIARDGAVCALGCLGAYQLTQEGVPWESAVRLVSAHTENDEYELDHRDTAKFGEDCGFPWSVAWEIGWVNDDTFATLTPEARWQSMLTLVEAWLADPQHARSPSTW